MWDEILRERMPRATEALRESMALFRSVTFVDIIHGDARVMFHCLHMRPPLFQPRPARVVARRGVSPL